MGRLLSERPSLDHLKREAKRLLREARSGQPEPLALLQSLPDYRGETDADVSRSATLLEMQLALARDYGFAGWAELKVFVESRVPRLGKVRPVFRIGSYQDALTHYRDWLGFNLDWDWFEAPGEPVIAAFSRDGVEFMVNEYPSTPGPSTIHITVRNLDALVDELNRGRPGSVEARIAPPYEFKDLPIEDPWGNVVVFEGQDETVETARREAVRPKMRRFVQEQLDAGMGYPTPEAVREAIGPPLGVAVEVLNEFDGYSQAYASRRAGSAAEQDAEEKDTEEED